MQHLGRADSIQHRFAGLGDPVVINRLGQRLSRRDGRAERRQIRPLLHGGQHRAIGGRCGETDGGFELLDNLDHIGRSGLFQQRRRRTKAQGKDRQPAQTEGEGQGWGADEHILRRDLQHLLGIAIRYDQQIAMEMHGGLGIARCSGGKPQKRHIIPASLHRLILHRLLQSEPVQFGIMVLRAVKADNLLEEFRRFGAGHQLIHQPRVTERKLNLGLIDNRPQLARTQHRHRVNHNRPYLGRRQPSRHHRRIVGRPDQHPVARLHPQIIDQSVRQTVRPVG